MQAAVGGTALDLVLDHGLGDDARTHAEIVLTLSVLVIPSAPEHQPTTRPNPSPIPNPNPNLNPNSNPSPNPSPTPNQVILITAPLGAVGIALAGWP